MVSCRLCLASHKRYFLQQRRRALDWLSERLGLQGPDDWNAVSLKEIVQVDNGGVCAAMLREQYEGSIYHALCEVYPEYTWNFWKFNKVIYHISSLTRNEIRSYFDWNAERLHIGFDQWYLLKPSDLKCLDISGSSLYEALSIAYPEHSWNAWRFKKVPNGFWNELSNQRHYMNWLGEHLSISHADDWYCVTAETISKAHGSGLLFHHYGDCVWRALMHIFPEREWLPWCFTKIPSGLWEDTHQVNAFIYWLRNRLEISHLSKWYSVATRQIVRLGGATLLEIHGGLCNLLMKLYPLEQWHLEKFRSYSGGKHQRELLVIIQELFPNREIHSDYRDGKLRFSETQRRMELDIYIPSLALAFEYQGAHHYRHFVLPRSATGIARNAVEAALIRDQNKRNACQKIGIHLIEVPYWWAGDRSSLVSTIRRYCPELEIPFQHGDALPIPEEPPISKSIPHLMLNTEEVTTLGILKARTWKLSNESS